MLGCICSGQSPSEADFNLLDTARKVEMYGIRLHAAKVSNGLAGREKTVKSVELELFICDACGSLKKKRKKK